MKGQHTNVKGQYPQNKQKPLVMRIIVLVVAAALVVVIVIGAVTGIG